MYIPIKDILIDETLYPRHVIYQQHIQHFIDALQAGKELPPIVVGKRGGRYVVIDGRRRYEAFRRLNKATLPAIVTKVPKKYWYDPALRFNHLPGQSLSYQKYIAAIVARQPTIRISKVLPSPEAIAKALRTAGRWLRPENIRPVVVKAPVKKAKSFS